MLTIRLKRVGRKNQPSYKVIVTPKKLGGPAGKPVEYLGWYNSLQKKFELKKERIQYWMSQGAQPSASLHNLLVKSGMVSAGKIPVHKKSKKPAEAAAQPVVASQPSAQAPVEKAEAQVQASEPQPTESAPAEQKAE